MNSEVKEILIFSVIVCGFILSFAAIIVFGTEEDELSRCVENCGDTQSSCFYKIDDKVACIESYRQCIKVCGHVKENDK